MQYFTLIAFVLFSFLLQGQEDDSSSDEMTVKKSFLIIMSTKNYQNALKYANEAVTNLNDSLNLRTMVPDSLEGLTTTATCECGENHGYIPRGRYDDGAYISIEYSNYFDGFAEGFYMVIVASGNKADLVKKQQKVMKYYTDAYIKTTTVYMGCMH